MTFNGQDRQIMVRMLQILLVLFNPQCIHNTSIGNMDMTVSNPAINSILRYFIRRHMGGEISNVQESHSEHSDSQSESALLLNTSAIFSCSSITTWRDLGDLKYPRLVRETECTPGTCFFGYSTCETIYHNTSILTVRDPSIHPEDQTLPTELRAEWIFTSVQLSVACVCSRYN